MSWYLGAIVCLFLLFLVTPVGLLIWKVVVPQVKRIR
jgi:hypothetical protein